MVPSGTDSGSGSGLGLGAFATYGQDYLSRQQIAGGFGGSVGPGSGGSGRPRGHTVAEADIGESPCLVSGAAVLF